MKRSIDMTSGPLFPAIIRFTVPLILTSLLQLFFTAADLMVVGQFCGGISVGAVGATTSITNLMVNFFIGISIGAGVATAQGIGARDDQDVHDTVHTMLPLAILSGLVLTVVGMCLAERLLTIMGTPANVLPLSTLYMRIIFGGVTFNLIYNFCAAILRAAGDTRSPLIFLTVSGAVNVVLNVIFVTVFDMNVAGVALATVSSHAISAVLVLRALRRREDACHLEWREIGFRRRQLWKMIRIGLPAGIQSSLFSISNVVIQSSINSFGDVMMAGNAASVSIEGVIYTVVSSFQQAAVNFVGQNAGAKQYRRTLKTLFVCVCSTAVISFAASALIYLLGPTLLAIYIPDSPASIDYGMTRLAIVGLFYFIFAILDACTGALRGLGKSFVPMLISVLGICGFRILWVYSVFRLPEYHTPLCLYLSFPISWVITLLFQAVAFLLVYRGIRRKEGALK